MRVVYLENINDYKQYLNTTEETHIFVKDLTHRGIFILQEMIEANKNIYAGKLSRHKDNWFNFYITGNDSPKIKEYQWQNVKMRSYESLLGDHDYTKEQIEEALTYIYQNFQGMYGAIPSTPGSIVANYLKINSYMKYDATAVKFSHGAFQPGAINIMPQYINQCIRYETHLDIRQAYASIMKNNLFPIGEPEYIDSDVATKEEFDKLLNSPLNIIHIIGGIVKLKPNGFPLLQSNAQQKSILTDKKTLKTLILDEYNIEYDISELYDGLYLTTPAYQVLLQNYDIIEPLQVLDGIYWKQGQIGIGTNFINKIYELRTTTTNPALKNFAKLCNEYCAGMFERKFINEANPWQDLDGNKKKGIIKKSALNCSIGDFITDYLRLQISNILQLLPHDWIIGYDTDGIFIGQPREDIEPMVAHLLGNKPGQCHFDCEYEYVTHLANKQYYGFDTNGVIFGKIAGVNNGDEVAEKLLNHVDLQDITVVNYVWNKKDHKYNLVEQKAKLKLNIMEDERYYE